MSIHEQTAAAILAQGALAADGVFLGLALAYVAVRSIIKFTDASSALRKVKDSPSVRVSDLRSVLSPSDGSDTPSEEGKLVIVRGFVEAKSAVDGNWKHLRPNVLVSHESGDRGVIIRRTQTVPFILVESGKWPQNDYLIVNMDGSRHPLPLVTVFHQLQPITPSPYTFLQALFGHDYPVGLLDEEKILPLGKDISAVGICSLRDGVAEIKSCNDLPYFLSDMTKDQMVVDIALRTKILFWSGIVFGALSIGILGFAAVRNWNRWKARRQQRQAQQQNNLAREDADPEIAAEGTEEIPDGELCVICLTRRRRSAFIPCGHLVCCQRCALSVERDLAPKCPVCRQSIRTSVRIYDS
ncbi:hypothetical protein RHSIM_Rhsim08G0239400 [Rhododendron simsii]|uniref:RING-type E3 ubiquitin transferase n=1 Tax=Rhododendron simsii TaxID=118357 RepID=A0A834GS01_RHOSS|nr:hypothetical protein RHSIM_Rhsim08G0239400 [Rhododendron simsii]